MTGPPFGHSVSTTDLDLKGPWASRHVEHAACVPHVSQDSYRCGPTHLEITGSCCNVNSCAGGMLVSTTGRR